MADPFAQDVTETDDAYALRPQTVDAIILASATGDRGKLLTLLFVPFAAWLAGSSLASSVYSSLLAAGIPSYFAKAQLALPCLMDLFGLPHDLFQLYIPTTILTGKFDSMVTAMNLLVFALLGAGALGGAGDQDQAGDCRCKRDANGQKPPMAVGQRQPQCGGSCVIGEPGQRRQAVVGHVPGQHGKTGHANGEPKQNGLGHGISRGKGRHPARAQGAKVNR